MTISVTVIMTATFSESTSIIVSTIMTMTVTLKTYYRNLLLQLWTRLLLYLERFAVISLKIEFDDGPVERLSRQELLRNDSMILRQQ